MIRQSAAVQWLQAAIMTMPAHIEEDGLLATDSEQNAAHPKRTPRWIWPIG